jgi:hypothetical protein
MAGYIGHKPKLSKYAVDEFTTSAAQASSGDFTLSQTVSDSKLLEVSVGGIDQPQSAYTVSGTTLSFGANIITQGDIVIVRHAGESIMYPTLEDGAVSSSAKIAANAVDSANITAGAVDLAHMSANSVDSLELKAGSVDLAHLAATGTPTASLALKGDYSWGTAGGPSLGSGNEYLRTNSNQINQSITVPVGTNASSVGPVTVGTAYNVLVNGVYTII